MCIVIDVNVLSKVFDTSNSKHSKFEPVYDWIINGKGKIVFGGTKYLKELKKMGRYLNLLRQLKDAQQAIQRDTTKVDMEHREVKKISNSTEFDDKHLVGIIRESKCKLICSDDTRSFKFIKDPKFYNSGSARPSIYSQKSNKNLLNAGYIAQCCKPARATTKNERNKISGLN